ncbi:MAG: WecB/TagA/CpsF family glycosyltransferase [Candidatus Sumerlaeaceae bacterium]|nr:WecB/TagA/CpsF family glycosyltransferase [Candidatus Sumerlaeaceae bacterium]
MVNSSNNNQSRIVIGTRVDLTSVEQTARWILDRARREESCWSAHATVHMLIEARNSPEFARVLNGCNIVNPDGLPLVWMQKLLGARNAGRATGTETTLRVCEIAAADEVPVGFYGGTEETLRRLQDNLTRTYPSLKIAYACSPPFRALSPDEDAKIVADIAASGTRILFVGLGCPKQERWCHDHRGRIMMPMVAIGAAFDFIAGTVPRAPKWVQGLGLEWLHRLLQEPRRLAYRYFVYNTRFLALVTLQLLGLRKLGAPQG